MGNSILLEESYLTDYIKYINTVSMIENLTSKAEYVKIKKVNDYLNIKESMEALLKFKCSEFKKLNAMKLGQKTSNFSLKSYIDGSSEET